jgi:beta-lactamase superfamily II metal-dependent hydrolase
MSLGDLDYKYLPKDLPFYDVDYLVIPHHGSFQSGICPFKTHDIEAQAIVPVGFNNYENPSRIMLNVLQNRGFKIHDTYQDKSFYGFL